MGKVVGILIGRVGVVSSIPTGGNFIFCSNFLKHSMSVLYRNARYVLKTKNSNNWTISFVKYIERS